MDSSATTTPAASPQLHVAVCLLTGRRAKSGAHTRFHHAPWDAIKQDDVLTWLAWSCFNMDLAAVRADARKNRFLTRSLTMLEARTGTTFPPGRTGLRIIRLTLDPVNVESRPLIIYAIANGINWFLARVYYPWSGMKLCREGDIE